MSGWGGILIKSNLFIILLVFFVVAFLAVRANADVPSSMSDRELANFISKTVDNSLGEGIEPEPIYCNDNGCSVVVQ